MRGLTVLVCVLLADAACAVGQNISVSGVQGLSVSDAETQVDVASGGTAKFDMVDYDVTVRAQAGGSVRFGIYTDETVTTAAWASKVALWLDASHEETLLAETNKSGKISTTTDKSISGKFVAINRWLDRRPEQTTWRGYNNRGGTGTRPAVMPFVVSNACNGLTYVSLGTMGSQLRRLPFIKVINGVEQAGNAGREPPNAIPATYVVMVFGSQNGGGQAVISEAARANTSVVTAGTGIFANSSRATRLDGAEVANPTTTGFNGGWQLLSFDASDLTVKGVGYNKWGNVYGGQNYAELLVFTNTPTASEIKSVEAYLARKWGVSTFAEPAEADGSVRLYGEGSVHIDDGVAKVGGLFKGVVNVATGTTLKLTDTQPIPANAAALEVEGTSAIQYDTDRSDLTVANSEKPTSLYESLYSLENVLFPKYKKLFGYNRGAAFVGTSQFTDSWNWGPDRRWCAYATKWTQGRGSNTGNTSRFDNHWSGSGYTYDARTLFMVLDTSAGGGTPIMDTDITSPSYIKVRTRKESPVFTMLNNHVFVTNSPTFLNGVAIKPGERAFNGRAELLSCVFTESVPVKGFGNWQNTDADCDLRHGEIILYQGELSDADRRDTEAYLMNKWLGIAPSGYGDLSGMTVDGAGMVVAASGLIRPQFASTFTGTFDLTAAETLTFTASGSEVQNTISVAGGAVTLPETVTVRVNVQDSSLPEGGVVLVSAETLTGAGSLTLEVIPEIYQAGCVLLKRDSRIILMRQRRGMIISVQ